MSENAKIALSQGEREPKMTRANRLLFKHALIGAACLTCFRLGLTEPAGTGTLTVTPTGGASPATSTPTPPATPATDDSVTTNTTITVTNSTTEKSKKAKEEPKSALAFRKDGLIYRQNWRLRHLVEPDKVETLLGIT